MDDDKNLIEKAIEAVKDIAQTASEAAKHAMEPELIKPGEEVVMLAPEASGLLGEPAMPQYVVMPRKKSRTKKAVKKTAKKTVKKTAKKLVKKKAAKKWKSPSKKAVAKKSSKKAVKKKKVKRGGQRN
jgi:hypothetical protein